MRLVITTSFHESAVLCAEVIAQTICSKNDALLGLATGSTPIPVYQELVHACKAGRLDLSQVHVANLDEYVGLDGSDPHSYLYYMRHHLFEPASIPLSNVIIPCGSTDPQQELKRLNSFANSNRIDIQLLSVGMNGHIGFNEPNTIFHNKYHIVKLTEQTRQSNSRLFEQIEDVPTHAITMGIGTIMQAKRIVFLATGEEKLTAMKAILEEGEVTPQIQGTILKLHQDCTVFLDKALAQNIVPAPEVEVSYHM